MPEAELEHQEEEYVDTSEEDKVHEQLEKATEEEESEEKPEEKPQIEDLAREMGWKPKEDFVGHEDDYVDAAEYIRRSKDIQESMRQHLKDNKKKMSNLERALGDLKTHNETVYKSQLKDLKSQIESTKKQRKEAIEDGDVEQVEELDGKISDLYNEVAGRLQNMTPKTEEPQFNPEEVDLFKGWTQQNNWYKKPGAQSGDDELTKYADYLADLPEYAGLPYQKKLDVVTRKVKETFPEKFNESKSTQPPTVESGSRKSAQKNRYTKRDLSPDHREIMNNFVKQGIMTEQQYIDDLVKIGELS